MSVNKRTTKTINRRTRHILKRESDKLAEVEKPKNDLPASFKPSRRAKKKGSIKYEKKPVSRETKIDQKVKNWKLKKTLEQPHTCQKCGGWAERDSCHCKCVQETSNQALIKEINRRLKNRELNFELEPVVKKKVGSKK